MPATSPRKAGGELAALQRAVASTLMAPMAPGERMQRSARAVAERFIKPNDRLSSLERLQIYNQQYWWRLLGSFREDFRGLLAVLGERKFERLAVAYLQSFGSRSWNLRDLGQGLESFVREHPQMVAPQNEIALDMVRVEWARVIAFDGAEKPRLDAARLGRDPTKLRLGLQPYLSVLTLTYPIDQMLGRMRKRAIESSSNAVSQFAGSRRRLRLSARPASEVIHLAVHRVDLFVYYKRLDPAAGRLLTALGNGATLSDACDLAFGDEAPDDAPARIQSWFASWMRFGWLTR